VADRGQVATPPTVPVYLSPAELSHIRDFFMVLDRLDRESRLDKQLAA
jgi:hypothetical protein